MASDVTSPLLPLPDMQAASTMDDTLESQPYANAPHDGEVPALDSRLKSFFSMSSFLISCAITPLIGFSFVALGLGIIYSPDTCFISYSTKHVARINQGFTTLFSLWNIMALIPALSVVKQVRSEEWQRRLWKGTSFNRVNSVSSNIGGIFSHTVEVIGSWSSPYFKCAWIAAVAAIILVDVAPGAIHVETGLTVVPKSFLVPSLPPNSVYDDYSSPFDTTGDEVHPSSGIAPVYLAAYLYAGTYVDATPPSPNMLVPYPNISPNEGYRYSTDV
jgi:hypothetical protein